jgi:hypothetical protein
MTITLVGDLKYGLVQEIHSARSSHCASVSLCPSLSRTVHSLVKLLAMFHGIRLVYICPDSLRMPEEVIDEVNSIALKLTGEPLEQVCPLLLSTTLLMPLLAVDPLVQ